MYTEIVSYSGQARGFRPYALLGVGALSVGVWASLAGAGVAAADNQSSRAPGAAVSATPTASAKVPKSTRPTTRSARVRAGATAGVVDLTGGAFTDFAMSPGVLDQLGSDSGSQPPPPVMTWATTAGNDYPKYQVGMVSPRY